MYATVRERVWVFFGVCHVFSCILWCYLCHFEFVSNFFAVMLVFYVSFVWFLFVTVLSVIFLLFFFSRLCKDTQCVVFCFVFRVSVITVQKVINWSEKWKRGVKVRLGGARLRKSCSKNVESGAKNQNGSQYFADWCWVLLSVARVLLTVVVICACYFAGICVHFTWIVVCFRWIFVYSRWIVVHSRWIFVFYMNFPVF